MQDNEKWSSMKEISEHLGVSRETVLNWIEKGGMPTTKAGRLWKFKISEVDTWLRAGGPASMNYLANIQNDSKASIAKQLVESQLNEKGVSATLVKSILKIFVTCMAEQFKLIEYSTTEIEEMAQEAFLSHLSSWLIDATNTYQSPYAFTQQQHPTWNHDDGEFLRYKSGIERGVEAYYKRFFNLNSSKTLTEQKKEHHLIALYFADFIYDDASYEGLTLYRDLFIREKEMEVKKTKRNIIFDGYANHIKLLQSIKQEKDNKAYVAKALTFIQIECLHRFLLAYRVFSASYASDESTLNNLIRGLCWYYQPIPSAERKEGKISLASVRFDNNLIASICANELSNSAINKIYWSRFIIQASLDLLHRWAPNCLKADWTDDTFNDVAQFFRHEYQFDSLSQNIDIGLLANDEDNEKANALRELILNIYNPQNLDFLRFVIRSHNKKKK